MVELTAGVVLWEVSLGVAGDVLAEFPWVPELVGPVFFAVEEASSEAVGITKTESVEFIDGSIDCDLKYIINKEATNR